MSGDTNSKTNSKECKQISRLEAKVDGVIDILKQIQRMIIPLTAKSSIGASTSTNEITYNFHSTFPITNEESMDKFEMDLNDNAFRQAVVSVGNFFLFSLPKSE